MRCLHPKKSRIKCYVCGPVSSDVHANSNNSLHGKNISYFNIYDFGFFKTFLIILSERKRVFINEKVQS